MNVPNWLETLLTLEQAQYGRSAGSEAFTILERLVSRPAMQPVSSWPQEQQINVFNRMIFCELGMRYSWRGSGDDFLLVPTLRNRAGNCLGLTTIYIAIAAALDVPIRPLLFDGHIAAAHLGKLKPVRIEPTRCGAVIDESLARRLYGDCEGRCLSDQEFLAVHLSNRAAFVLAPAGQKKAALELLDAALGLFPEYGAAWLNKSALLVTMGRTAEAVDAMSRTLTVAGSAGEKTKRLVAELAEHLELDAAQLLTAATRSGKDYKGSINDGQLVRSSVGR